MTREEAKIFLLQLNTDKQLNKSEHEALRIAIKALEQEPTDDATLKDIFCMGCEYKEQEPKTGHWIMTGDYLITASGNVDYVKCSCCREYSLEEGNYCPNCGCHMIEPQESEK